MTDDKHVIHGSYWFTLRDGTLLGVVLMNNGYEDKAYIGRGRGMDEQEDEKYISEWGVPFPVEQATAMIMPLDYSNIVIDSNTQTFRCNRCEEAVSLPTPCKIDTFIQMGNGFVRAHQRCNK